MRHRATRNDLKKFFSATTFQKPRQSAGNAHQPMNKIQARYLATGDRVRFSRDGWQTVGRITNCNSISVSFMFSDGIIRKLEARREYVVEKAEKSPEPQPGQI